jgi:ABC-type multidrug transport system fused ATPase/permease subunit
MSYAGLGGEFDIRKVYTCMSILNITRLPIALFPMARAAAKEATTSLDRIQKYLLTPDIKRLDHGTATPNTTAAEYGNCDEGAIITDGGGGLQLTQIEASSSFSSSAATTPGADSSSRAKGAVLASISGGYFSWSDSEAMVEPAGAEAIGSGPLPQQDPDLEDGISNDDESACVLRNVNLTVYDGESIAIVGSVGAG